MGIEIARVTGVLPTLLDLIQLNLFLIHCNLPEYTEVQRNEPLIQRLIQPNPH